MNTSCRPKLEPYRRLKTGVKRQRKESISKNLYLRISRRGFLRALNARKQKEATQRGNTASPCFPVAVLTTATKNREQEVMLSSPVSLAPPDQEQSRCH